MSLSWLCEILSGCRNLKSGCAKALCSVGPSDRGDAKKHLLVYLIEDDACMSISAGIKKEFVLHVRYANRNDRFDRSYPQSWIFTSKSIPSKESPSHAMFITSGRSNHKEMPPLLKCARMPV